MGASPIKGPVLQVWGLEDRQERNQMGAPRASISSPSGAQNWGWVKCSLLREEEGGKYTGERRLWDPHRGQRDT